LLFELVQMLEDSCEDLYLSGPVLVRKEVFEVFVLYKMEVCPRSKDVKVFGYGQRLVRRMAEVEEVEGGGRLGRGVVRLLTGGDRSSDGAGEDDDELDLYNGS
jgi:hypothetical protein